MDVVVTCPKSRWEEWLTEGGLPGDPNIYGSVYHWFGSGPLPRITIGERVYIMAHRYLRGYAPLVRIERIEHYRQHPPSWWWPGAQWALVRRGGAVACTVAEPIRGFQGYRYRWWDRDTEKDFPDWQSIGVRP